VVDAVEDEPLFTERAAGVDIGKAEVVAAVRVPGPGGRRMQEVRSFPATRRGLEELADWLDGHGVTRAGMESTSDYWKPVFFTLERRGFGCSLYNSRQVKAQPGRPKTDKADAVWLARITEHGWVRSSFVPPEEIRVLRAHTRYRRRLVQARTAQVNRTEKLLEEGHLKLSSVISDIHGVSGRAMLDALAGGQRDPKVLAQLARGVMRRKIPQLEEALDCSFFTPPLARLLARMLEMTDQITAQIQDLDADIALLCAPFEAEIARLDQVDGIARRTAEDVIAETGADMTVFPTAGHLVSWAKLCPQVRESAGRRKGRNAAGDGNAYLSAAISEAVIGALRTPSFTAARYKRLIRRMPKKKALVATGNTMLTIIWHLLADPDATYRDLGADYHELRDPARQARNHLRSLERLGYHVTLHAINPETGELTPTAA
jgi:transposase